MSGQEVALVEVQILDVPMDLYRRAAEHTDELQREFALVLLGPDVDEGSVPARLLRLIDELNARFGQFSVEQTARLEAVMAGGGPLHLTYRVPPEVKEAAAQLGAILDEADAFCLSGQHLLTLATPPGPLAFRRWFLGEFVAQIDGATPTPWGESPFASGQPDSPLAAGAEPVQLDPPGG